MVNKSKILSDLSKMAVDAMSTFSGVKKEIETIVRLRVDKVVNKMNLVKRDEFEVLKKMVQKIAIENKINQKHRKTAKKKKKSSISKKKRKKKY
tara:strand:+ start:3451 stop:3732 length:282 start_codon:yes stop_codon:yes gene_type:complete